MDESNSPKPAVWPDHSTEEASSKAAAIPEDSDAPAGDKTPPLRAPVRAATLLDEETPSPADSNEAGPADRYTVKLEAFEGPLDLLLYMIRREEIDIWNIPIARITTHYLEYIKIMRELNLNVAGEFLVMAATLIHIKSRMLLPPDPSQADGAAAEEDPRHELVYQLLEHEKFKNAAQMLYAKEAVESEVWNKPPREFIEEGEEMVTVTLFDMVRAYRDIVQRFAERITLEYHREEITVDEKMAEIRNRLLVQSRLVFSTLFQPGVLRRILVVTFLAVLELVRLGEIRLSQDQALSEIFLQKSTQESEAMEMGATAT